MATYLNKQERQNLLQVWFAGVHINCGGGSDDKGADVEGLANITFAWMVEQCRSHLAFKDTAIASIQTYEQALRDENFDYGPDDEKKKGWLDSAKDWAHWGAQKVGLEKVKDPYAWPVIPNPKNEPLVKATNIVRNPVVRTPYASGQSSDSYTWMYKFQGDPVDRTPGATREEGSADLRLLSDIGTTNEMVHPSVAYRLMVTAKGGKDSTGKEMKPYKTNYLSSFKREKDPKSGYWAWTKGSTRLHEYHVRKLDKQGRPDIERANFDYDPEATKWFDGLDKDWDAAPKKSIPPSAGGVD